MRIRGIKLELFTDVPMFAVRLLNNNPAANRSPMKQLSKKDLVLLGSVLVEQQPALAEQLFSVYECIPVETDLARIEVLYREYLQEQGLQDQSYISADLRRLFIATMLRLYMPKVYYQPKRFRKFPRGFVTTLGRVIHQPKSHVSTAVDHVILWEKTVEPFKKRVDTVEAFFLSQRKVASLSGRATRHKPRGTANATT